MGNRTHFWLGQLLVVVAFTVALACNSASAQDHNHETVSVINGSDHPELIPDSVAYRLYFTTVSLPLHPTAEQAQLHEAQLGAIGLSDRGKQVMIEQLAIFKAKFDRLVANYNKLINAGREPNFSLFGIRQESLVADTRKALSSALAEEDLGRLNAYVQNEKRHMQVADEKGTK